MIYRVLGAMAAATVVQAQTCCEQNEEDIRVLEDGLQAVEQDLDDLFRTEFVKIEDRIIDIGNLLTEIEQEGERSDRVVIVTQNLLNRLEDDAEDSSTLITRLRREIADNVIGLIRDFGVQIGRWRLVEDAANNLLVSDFERGGAFRLLKTGRQREVDSTVI